MSEARNLADKYRPRKLADLVGATALVKSLQGLLSSKHLPNSILLFGPSGTGKTTTARMISRYLNCKTRDACGHCPSCKEHEAVSPTCPDYREVNAANTKGIDDMRELVAFSKYKPVYRARVIALDECHSLTPQAAQLLLKETEEPPAHTVWVLSTTNPEKLPHTLTSRARLLPTRRAEPKELAEYMMKVAKKEGAKVTKENKKQIEALLLEMAELSGCTQRVAMMMLGQVLETKNRSILESLKSWRENYDAEPDKIAIRLLASALLGNKRKVARAIFEAERCIRAVIVKLRYLTDNMLRVVVKASGGFRDYAARAFLELDKKHRLLAIPNSDEVMVEILRGLSEAEYRMNQGQPEIATLIACLPVNSNRRKAE